MDSFDNECFIIECFQGVENSKVFFPFESKAAENVFKQIHEINNWNRWTNSSSKSDLPPDFFCDEFCSMMEVMRVDDHTRLNDKGKYTNPTNAKCSELRKELKTMNVLPQILIINAITDLPTKEDHNFKFYLDSFIRVIEDHKSKIENYRKNHPGHKMIFFVFDESSAYIKPENLADADIELHEGDLILGRPHEHWRDKAFLEPIINSDIDFLIWYTPYKFCETDKGILELPEVCVFDIKAMNFETKDYDPDVMVSYED